MSPSQQFLVLYYSHNIYTVHKGGRLRATTKYPKVVPREE